MRTYSTLALLVLGLVLAPLLSPRPAVAASATVTYSFAAGSYSDVFNGFSGAGLTAGSVTVHLTGPTVVPGVSAAWTSASIAGLTWATVVRPLISFPNPTPPAFAGGGGTVGGSGSFNVTFPPGTASLFDPFGAGPRPIFLSLAIGSGSFDGFGSGTGGLFALGTDAGPWSLAAVGGLVEVSSSISIVPEPGSASLLGLGLLAFGGFAARLRARRGSRTS